MPSRTAEAVTTTPSQPSDRDRMSLKYDSPRSEASDLRETRFSTSAHRFAKVARIDGNTAPFSDVLALAAGGFSLPIPGQKELPNKGPLLPLNLEATAPAFPYLSASALHD